MLPARALGAAAIVAVWLVSCVGEERPPSEERGYTPIFGVASAAGTGGPAPMAPGAGPPEAAGPVAGGAELPTTAPVGVFAPIGGTDIGTGRGTGGGIPGAAGLGASGIGAREIRGAPATVGPPPAGGGAATVIVIE